MSDSAGRCRLVVAGPRTWENDPLQSGRSALRLSTRHRRTPSPMTTWRPPLWYDRLGGIAWRAVIITVAAVLLVSGLVALSSVILPVVLGLLFACGPQPLSRRLDRRGLRRWLSSLLAVLALFIVVVLVAWLTVRLVIDQWGAISSMLADGQATLEKEASDQGVDPSTAGSIGADVGEFVSTIAGMLVNGLVQLVPVAASVVATVLLSFVVAFFFLKDGAVMWHWIVTNLGDFGELADRTGRRVWLTLTGYIIGQTVIAVADATLITLGALALGVPQLGAVFMLTLFGAYIPYIGAFLSGLVAVLLAIGDAGIDKGIAMLAVVVIVQVLEGNVLQPAIQGRAVRLHPLVIALCVAAGAALAGFLGVFLAVPVAAAGFVTLGELRSAGIVGPAELGHGAADSGSSPTPERDA
jgi:predicted PurR-regulated permease PerM